MARKRKQTANKKKSQGFQKGLLAGQVSAAVEKLAELMQQNENIETARKACVDVLKLNVEYGATKDTANDNVLVDAKLAERLLKAMAGGNEE